MTVYEPESEWFISNTDTIEGDHNIYVDIGAAHPINKSLTHFVRDRGWSGVAIDGNSDYEHDWIQAGYGSHFCHALLSDQPRARFAIHDNAFTSRISDSPETDHPERWGIKHIIERDTVSLNAILEQRGIGKIDLLTIDLEGHEMEVLSTLDFEKHSPLFIISEYVTQGESTDPRVCQILLKRGYEVVHMTESNLIFRRK
jgi:FkbM family methyltransferase